MTKTFELTSGRIAAAFAAAAVADFLQLPLTAMSLSGVLTVPTELFDFFLDIALCVVLSVLLGGFHWVLAPAFLAEAIPFVDVLPTWTAAVGMLVWLRSQAAARERASAAAAAAVSLERSSGRDIERATPASFVVLERSRES